MSKRRIVTTSRKKNMNTLPPHTIRQNGLPVIEEARKNAAMSEDELMAELERRVPKNVNSMSSIEFLDLAGPTLTQILLDKYIEELKVEKRVNNLKLQEVN